MFIGNNWLEKRVYKLMKDNATKICALAMQVGRLMQTPLYNKLNFLFEQDKIVKKD